MDENIADNLQTLITGTIALAHAIDNTSDPEANNLLLKAMDAVVYLLDVPRGELIEVDFTSGTGSN